MKILEYKPAREIAGSVDITIRDLRKGVNSIIPGGFEEFRFKFRKPPTP